MYKAAKIKSGRRVININIVFECTRKKREYTHLFFLCVAFDARIFSVFVVLFFCLVNSIVVPLMFCVFMLSFETLAKDLDVDRRFWLCSLR